MDFIFNSYALLCLHERIIVRVHKLLEKRRHILFLKFVNLKSANSLANSAIADLQFLCCASQIEFGKFSLLI